MAQLGRFYHFVQDGSGNAISGQSVTLYREGATISGNQSGTSPLTITVRHRGKIAAADTVFIETVTGTTYAVDSVTATTVVVSGFAGTLAVTDGQRIIPSNTKPTLYSDDQGGATAANPLTSSATGRVSCWMETGAYDFIVSGAGVTATAHIGLVTVGEAPAVVFSGETDSATAIAHALDTKFALLTVSGTNVAGGAKLFTIRNNGTEKLSVDWDGRIRLQAQDLNLAAAGGTRVGITAKMTVPASPGTADDIGMVGYVGIQGATTIGADRIAAGLSGSAAAVSGATITGSLLGVEGGTIIGGAHVSNAIFGLKGNVGGDGTETGTLVAAYAVFADPNQAAFAVGLTVTDVYGVWAGMPLSGTGRWALWSDGTTKINGRLDFGTTDGGFTSSTNSIKMGAAGVDAPQFQLHASATLAGPTLPVKQIASQTGNLVEARDSNNVIVGGIGPGGPIFTFTKAGTPTDADFTTAPPVGSMVVDTTANKLWVRTAAATWKFAALT